MEYKSHWFSDLLSGKGFGFLESVKSVTTDFSGFQNFVGCLSPLLSSPYMWDYDF